MTPWIAAPFSGNGRSTPFALRVNRQGAQVDDAGIDMLLVGDSAAMVVHGHDNTLPITLDEMLTHCKAAARGARAPFLIGDLPFGTYETGAPQAVGAAVRMLKEGSMDAVKLEGAPRHPGALRRVAVWGVLAADAASARREERGGWRLANLTMGGACRSV